MTDEDARLIDEAQRVSRILDRALKAGITFAEIAFVGERMATLSREIRRYMGQWVAIYGQCVYAHGATYHEMVTFLDKAPPQILNYTVVFRVDREDDKVA